MKIAFVGKGGSGKTTLSSLFIRHLAAARVPVLAIDADINQHLGPPSASTRTRQPRCPRSAPICRRSRSTCGGANPRIGSPRP